MSYELGAHSRRELEGVHPDLVAIVELAIGITQQDFTVHDGLRTVEEQQEYVRRGTSKIMRSKHLRQSDGYGHAVDLVPYINGKLRWELGACFVIARAVTEALTAVNSERAKAGKEPIRIVWGGGWQALSPDLSPEASVDLYVERKRAQGKRAFIDGPHFQLA